MSASWKNELFAVGKDELPEGYCREAGLVGRDTLLERDDPVLWSDSEFVARARVAHTTSAVEAEVRRRHLERLVREYDIDRGAPTLDLGCADGTFAHHLLDLGFAQLVSTDILHSSVATLSRSIDPNARERTLLIVDDMLRLPFEDGTFATVIAWGVLSVTGDFDRALASAWRWLRPGGCLLLGEPLREQALVYALVRGDLEEMRRVLREGTRPAMWDKRSDRYQVNPLSFYERRLSELPDAHVVERGGLNMLPSLVLGGLAQDRPVDDDLRAELAAELAAPELDDLALWRQAFWLVRKG
jgi:SAM-dependent methyltransferase